MLTLALVKKKTMNDMKNDSFSLVGSIKRNLNGFLNSIY